MKTTVFFTLPCLVLFTLLAGGCFNEEAPLVQKETTTINATENQSHAGHAHAEAGAHGGEVYIVGNDVADVELKHDHETDQVTVWLTNHEGQGLDSGESITLQLYEDGKFVDHTLTKTDSIGMYQLTDETVCEALENSKHLKGRLHVTVDDKKVTASIDHHEH